MSAIQQLLTDNIGIWTAADAAKRTGRGRASSNAGSVYGVRKLRELIYDLAATGLLVNHESEFTVQELLLGDVSDFVMGQAPPGNECNTNGQGTVFVKTGEFGVLYPEVKEWTTKPLKFAQEGDVLICVVGATIGKLNLGIDCAIGRSVAAIRPNKKILTEYLYVVLVPFTIRLRENSRGSAQPVIGKAELSAVKIRVTSIAEQHRIVAKVDELMALCDQLEAQHNNAAEAHDKIVSVLLQALTQSTDATAFADNWQRIAAHFDTLFTTEASIDALKQALLQLAVMGKLVPQDANDEPASELLKKIRAEKDGLIKEKRYQKTAALNPKKEACHFPKNWSHVQIGEICPSIVPNRDKPKSFSGNIPWITLPSFPSEGWFLDDGEFDLGLTEEEVTRFSARIIPEYSILMSCVGRFGLTAINRIPVVPNQQIHAFIVSKNLVPEFLSMVIRVSGKSLEQVATSTTIAYLNKTNCESIEFGLPPLAEQRRIVAKVDELMVLCDQLKARIGEAGRLQQKIADVVVEGAMA